MYTKNIILGYGNVGKLVAAELSDRGEDVLVARHGADDTKNVESNVVDVLDAASVAKATKGCDKIFVTTGLPYKLTVRQRDWPLKQIIAKSPFRQYVPVRAIATIEPNNRGTPASPCLQKRGCALGAGAET